MSVGEKPFRPRPNGDAQRFAQPPAAGAQSPHGFAPQPTACADSARDPGARIELPRNVAGMVLDGTAAQEELGRDPVVGQSQIGQGEPRPRGITRSPARSNGATPLQLGCRVTAPMPVARDPRPCAPSPVTGMPGRTRPSPAMICARTSLRGSRACWRSPGLQPARVAQAGPPPSGAPVPALLHPRLREPEPRIAGAPRSRAVRARSSSCSASSQRLTTMRAARGG